MNVELAGNRVFVIFLNSSMPSKNLLRSSVSQLPCLSRIYFSRVGLEENIIFSTVTGTAPDADKR